jgi:hypothetical protein
MKVTFRQAGGWGGLFWGAELDTDVMPSEEAAELRSLVKQSGILTADSGFSKKARDAQTYEIDVETDEGVQKLTFDDTTVPESAETLLEFLRGKAVPRKPG